MLRFYSLPFLLFLAACNQQGQHKLHLSSPGNTASPRLTIPGTDTLIKAYADYIQQHLYSDSLSSTDTVIMNGTQEVQAGYSYGYLFSRQARHMLVYTASILESITAYRKQPQDIPVKLYRFVLHSFLTGQDRIVDDLPGEYKKLQLYTYFISYQTGPGAKSLKQP